MIRSLPFILLALGCGGGSFHVPTTPAHLLSSGGTARNVSRLTDFESVQDIAVVGAQVYAATSQGLWVFSPDGSAAPVPRFAGQNILAIAPSDPFLVATPEGVSTLEGEPQALPEIGEIVGLFVDDSGTVWAGGTRGLAQKHPDGWTRFGDEVQVTAFYEGSGAFWVGTARGLLRIDGDHVEQHAEGRGLAAGYTRSLVALGEGKVMALMSDANYSYLSYYDSERWTNYTIDGFDSFIVGLGHDRQGLLVFTTGYTLRLSQTSAGVPLLPLSRGERLSTLHYDGHGGIAARTERALVALRPPSRLAAVPPSHPSLEAPAWSIDYDQERPTYAQDHERVWRRGTETFVSSTHQGFRVVGHTDRSQTVFSTGTLVSERDLRIVSDERGRTWVLSDNGALGRWQDGRFETITPPAGLSVHAISSASRGIYIAGLVQDSGASGAVRILRYDDENWQLVDERRLLRTPTSSETSETSETETTETANGPAAEEPTVVGVPLLAIRDDEEIWIALRVQTGSQIRRRGLANYRPTQDAVTYHHAMSDSAVDGEGALRIPDEMNNLDLGETGMIWMSTLTGAVRLGDSQAVVFGESRGVRGEVTSDVLVAPAAKVWLAAAEGPGYYHRQQFEFRMPPNVIAARPTALALDANGAIWGAGPRGLIRLVGDEWTVFGNAVDGAVDDGIEEESFLDIEADAAGQLWVLGRDALWLLSEPAEVVAAE